MIGKENTDLELKKYVRKQLEKGVVEGVFPCGAAGIIRGTGKKRQTTITHYGKASLFPEMRKLKKGTYFDLASLTKPLATTLAILCLIKMKKIDTDETLSSLLGKKIKNEKAKITVKQLLEHSSGFPDHREYFKKLKNVPVNKKGGFVEKLTLQEELEYTPGTKTVYSDLGFILLGRIVEKRAGCPLEQFVKEWVLEPINLQNGIFYKPLSGKNFPPPEEFAATENCPWREKTLCGEVHDDNCYTMGGVAGHSGLFGNIESVTTLAGFILDMWKGMAVHPNIENKDLINFLVRKKEKQSSRVLGFDTVSKNSSSGNFFSDKTVGHLGFSGTSFWVDPEKEVVIVLLSNRVHPTRENNKIKQFRPFFHDRVMEKILKNKRIM